MSMTTDKPPADHPDEGSYWHSRKTVAAGLVLALVAAAAAWAALSGNDGPAPAASPAAYDSACGLTGGSTAEPTRGPDVQWQNLNDNWLPISATQGPGRRENGGAWSCFAHTRTGAVLAALTIPSVVHAADDFASAVREQTVPGSAQLAMLKRGQDRDTPADPAAPVGFVLDYYDEATATVTFYVRASIVAARCTATVQWFGGPNGDWLLRPASDGRALTSCGKAPDDFAANPEFVAWGPHA
jgi:hypothetical protein